MKTKAIPLLATAAGIAFLLALYLILGPSQNANEPLHAIGKITSLQGELKHRPPFASTFSALKVDNDKSIELFNQEQLATSQASEALINLKNDASFRVLENSRIVAEVDVTHPGGFIVTLLEGRISVLNSGTPKIRIFKDGREIDDQDLLAPQSPTISNEAGTSMSASLNEGLTITATSAPPELIDEDSLREKENGSGVQGVLTNEQIVRRLKQQMSFFHRCYLNFIHRSQSKASATGAEQAPPSVPSAENLAGSVILSFTIQRSGRVTNTEVIRSNFRDSTLHQCIVEVVDRTTFSPFEGEDVPILEFPISLQ